MHFSFCIGTITCTDKITHNCVYGTAAWDRSKATLNGLTGARTKQDLVPEDES